MKNHLKTAWGHIRRSPYQAMAAIGIMVMTFFLTSVFVLLAAGSEVILRYFETRPQVTAFLIDEADFDQVNELRVSLENSGLVSATKYVSKEEALSIYQELNQEDPLLLEMVTADILPASLEVSLSDLTHLEEVVETLRQSPLVEEVSFQEEVVRSLKSWTRNLRLIGLVLVGFMVAVSFLIVLVVISMKVAVRRQEIRILRLLGASFWYIRFPFILEGMIYGVTASFLAWSVSSLALFYSTPFLVEFLAGIPLFPVPLWFLLALLAGELLLGVFIGVFGSLVAARRYLRS